SNSFATTPNPRPASGNGPGYACSRYCRSNGCYDAVPRPSPWLRSGSSTFTSLTSHSAISFLSHSLTVNCIVTLSCWVLFTAAAMLEQTLKQGQLVTDPRQGQRPRLPRCPLGQDTECLGRPRSGVPHHPASRVPR